MAKKKTTKKSPQKREEIYVTQAMHEELRQELKHEISSVNLNVKALEKKMESRFKAVDARFDKMDGMFIVMSSELKKMNANFHRSLALIEEQRAENKTIWDKQALIEDRLTRLENS